MNNILRISLNKKVIITQPLYQYDYGQKLKFIDLPLYASYEVHFSNHEHGDATVSIATSNEVAIPDIYLQSGRDVYVWVYVHTGRDDGETEYQITIPVIKRAKPINEEPTPEEQSVITQTIAALNAAVTESREGVQRVEQAESNVNNLYALTEDAKNRTYTYKEEAELAASLLKNVSAEAETLQPGQPATASYADGVFNFGIPPGRDGGGGSSNILIVHATLDMEHAESETEIPLILDKTIDEMLAAEYTVLAIDYGYNSAGLYLFEFPEYGRISSNEVAQIAWKGILGDHDAWADAYEQNGEMTTTVYIQEGNELPTVDSSDDGKVLRVVDGSWTAAAVAADGILVVNATPDMEHAEGEELIPLILDKTMDEMLAAKYTVLAINEQSSEATSYYELAENLRVSSGDYSLIQWQAKLGVEYLAYAGLNDEGELSAHLEPHEENDHVLIANTTVAFEDLSNLTPENPLTITINKTYDQMRSADLSAVRVDITQDGVVGATVVFSINVVADSELFYGSPLANLAIGIRNELAVIVRSSNGNTVAQLMALPNT